MGCLMILHITMYTQWFRSYLSIFNGNPLQYSCLENSRMGEAVVLGVAKRWTQLNDFTFHFRALEKEMATNSCSCLENPRDGGALWAAVYGVSQSQTWLKRLSSSSSKVYTKINYFPKGYQNELSVTIL